MPTPLPGSGASQRARSVAESVSMTNEAKYLPAASRITVTLEGTAGRTRDHFTLTAPILGSDSRPPLAPIRFPLRSPLREAKKFLYAASTSRKDCCSTTEETSPSQQRSTVCRAWVISRFDSSAAFGNGRPAVRASSRARTASLNTTRAHPNALANAVR
ncbi:hypothetical protein AQJ46_06440 [Streptomyces canus]|uniref:Uncharacterized protein n=1 Tax=Streptomyces canus TaxID=58343 RepID=A0A101SGL0_9ACTN|nr:hypothetical protein AQJ46_06440 [Streptomyces canus]